MNAPTKFKSGNWMMAAYHKHLTSGGKGQGTAKPGMQLACDGGNCGNKPDIEGGTPPAAAKQAKPGMLLACPSGDGGCLTPGLNDERLAQAAQSPILVCIEAVCELRQKLDATMLTCESKDCFAPDNQAEQTTTR
jgi:hypothetical protein